MTSILPFIVVLAILLILAMLVWVRLRSSDSVPDYLSDAQFRRLELRQRLRQTNYQIMTALGVGATFIATFTQLMITSQQWRQDHELRAAQERLGRYADGLKAIADKTAPVITSGVWSLFNLGLQDPGSYHFQVNEVLSTLVREKAVQNPLRESIECHYDRETKAGTPIDKLSIYERGEALPEVQAAMSALGHPKFAIHREQFRSGACQSWSGLSTELTALHLDHRYLDELDLGNKDFSCADLTQSRFHRVNFRHAILRGTDFGGARMADFEVPGFPEDTIKGNLYKPESQGGPPEWALFRCLVTDFREADLTKANFAGATLDGADFEGADLTNVNLCIADVSRANFTNAKGISRELFSRACVGKDAPTGSAPEIVEEAQPFGLGFKIFQCSEKKMCPSVPR